MIRKTVVSYINIILNAPENFEIIIEKTSYSADFKKFYNERDTEYVENFLNDFTKCTYSEYSNFKNIYDFYFDFIYHVLSYSPNPNVKLN